MQVPSGLPDIPRPLKVYCERMSTPTHPDPKHFVRNWREYDGSFATKLRLMLKNEAIKVKNRELCCGHPGEPGC